MRTRTKLRLVRLVQAPLTAAMRFAGSGPIIGARRMGINWILDLREGIDFSIWLLGAFERPVRNAYRRLVRPGMVALDVGANIGAHTLPLAKLVGKEGLVVAFEPAAWAFDKLRANIAANPELSGRIKIHQTMLLCSEDAVVPPVIDASWPITPSEEVRADLRSAGKSTKGAVGMTLDRYMESTGPGRVDFIKLDVDGYESDVLRGAQVTIERFRPVIVIEVSPYIARERGNDIQDALSGLEKGRYRLFDLRGRKPLDVAQLCRSIPVGAGRNVLMISC